MSSPLIKCRCGRANSFKPSICLQRKNCLRNRKKCFQYFRGSHGGHVHRTCVWKYSWLYVQIRTWLLVVYVWHKLTELAHSFLSCSCVGFRLYGPFYCISFHKFSIHLSAFSLCSSCLISALLVLSTIYLFMKVFFSPDVIPSGWLGSKHKLNN